MQKQFVLGLVLLSLTLAANGSSLSGRIVGGSIAPAGKYPYHVSLWIGRTTFQCGGSIINERYVLTAAHCIVDVKAYEASVIVGSNSLSQGGTRYQAGQLIPHKDFRYGNNDIGLIRMLRKIIFNDKVQPIGLPTEDLTKEGSVVVLTGWGSLSAGSDDVPDALQEIKLKVIGEKDCENKFESVTSKQMCTLNGLGEGACNGDSGGPLVADGVVVGIVSMVMPCALNEPDIHTRVHSYIDWITNHLE